MDASNPYSPPAHAQPLSSPSPELPTGAALVSEVQLPADAPSVESHLSPDDIQRCLDFWNRRQRLAWRTRLVVFGVLALPLGLVLFTGVQSTSPISGSVLGATAGFYVMLFAFWWSSRKHRQAALGANLKRRDAALLYWQRITLVPNYLVCADGLEQSLYRWPLVIDIEVTDEALYLIMETNRIYVVPRRTFTSASEFQQFADLAMRFQQLADSTVDTEPPSSAGPHRT